MTLEKEVSAATEAVGELIAVVERLRGEDGCPWDRAQTHESLRRYLIEETYEVAEAIDHRDPLALREELGDLLLQIIFHAELEREAGGFSMREVAEDEARKMVERHPHVFGDARAEEVLASWEASKSATKGRRTLAERLDSVPSCLPALLRAQKLLEKCAGGGGEALLPSVDAWDSILGDGEIGEEAAGDLLLSLTEALRRRGVVCEEALAKASARLLCRSEEL